MKRKGFLTVTFLAGAHRAHAGAKGKAAPSQALVFSSKMTLAEVAARLKAKFREHEDWAKEYKLPAALQGKSAPGASATATLGYLFGTGWEGSRLPATERKRGANYELARTPFVYDFGGVTYNVCNNRAWDWTVENKQVVIFPRVKADGDLVAASRRVRLDKVPEDLTIGTLLDELNAQTGVNVTNIFGVYHVAEAGAPLGEGKSSEVDMPMTAKSLPAPLQLRFTQGVTPGEFLSILCIGLNRHTQKHRGDWKWSCAFEGVKLVYTLRDYARVERK